LPKKSVDLESLPERLRNSELLKLPSVDQENLLKLDEIGIHTCEMLSILPGRLAEDMEIKEAKWESMIHQAKEKLGVSEEGGPTQLTVPDYISTGATVLDNLLEGGYMCGELTELVGTWSIGKSSSCVTAAAECMKKYDKQVIFIHTEIHQPLVESMLLRIGNARGVTDFMGKFWYWKVMNFDEQMDAFYRLDYEIKKHDVKLVICDSILNYLRADFPGQGKLAVRQQALNHALKHLSRIAQTLNVAVLLTNQTIENPGYGIKHLPVGGPTMHHSVGKLLDIRKSTKGEGSDNIKSNTDDGFREVIVWKSLNCPTSGVICKIDVAGLSDV